MIRWRRESGGLIGGRKFEVGRGQGGEFDTGGLEVEAEPVEKLCGRHCASQAGWFRKRRWAEGGQDADWRLARDWRLGDWETRRLQDKRWQRRW